MNAEYSFRARIWLYEGQGAWHFVTVPTKISAEIKAAANGRTKAWGSVSVTAMAPLGTRWKTSLFRDTKRNAYLLLVKAAVRAKEQWRVSDWAEITLLLA
ncbi:MAG: DUF1905 domain-containing protein [Acidobacteria bacterium]|nr:DUF1905 domain-containing protein [Acidobacteriota bacterium]